MQHQAQILGVVAFSGALGALARYASVQGATYLWGDRFPYGTLLVNVAGCILMGLAWAALPEPLIKSSPPSRDDTQADLASPEPQVKTPDALWLRYGLMVGFLGAYTTFSAFSLDTFRHLQEGEAHWAFVNILANLALCLAAVWAGVRLGETIF